MAVESQGAAPDGAAAAQRSLPSDALVVGALTVSGLAMTASTYLVFVLVARRSSPTAVGMFALAMTLVGFAGQLADLGEAQYAIREVARAGGALTMLRWAARRRMARAAAFGIVAAAACWIRGIPPATAAMVVGIVLAVTYFSLLQAACRAQFRFWHLSALQLMNGLAYILVAVVAWLVWRRWTVSVAIGVPTAALVLLVALTLGTGRRYFSRPVGPIVHGRDRKSFARILLSNVVSGNADLLALGLYRPALAGRYATAERPAYGLAAVATAVTSVSLPRLATVNSRRLRSAVRGADLLLPIVVAAGLVAVVVGPPVLRAVYGNAGLVPDAVVPLLVVAYGLSIPHSLYSNTCLALRRGEYLSRVAAVQAVILVPMVVGWMLAGSLTGVAAGVLAARSVGIVMARVFVARALRDPATAEGLP